MSRSLWALTRQHAPAGADRPGRSERGSCSLAFAASSAKQYLLTVLIMAGLVGLAVVPTPALAASGSRADRAARGASASAQPHGLMVLAFGSGYASPAGSREVRALQHRLARAGFIPGPFDGRYGRLTRAAVMRFQAARGLVVDGIAGPITLGVLGVHGRVLYPGSGYAGNGSTRVQALQRRLRRGGVLARAGRRSLRAADRGSGNPVSGRARTDRERDRRPGHPRPASTPGRHRASRTPAQVTRSIQQEQDTRSPARPSRRARLSRRARPSRTVRLSRRALAGQRVRLIRRVTPSTLRARSAVTPARTTRRRAVSRQATKHRRRAAVHRVSQARARRLWDWSC